MHEALGGISLKSHHPASLFSWRSQLRHYSARAQLGDRQAREDRQGSKGVPNAKTHNRASSTRRMCGACLEIVHLELRMRVAETRRFWCRMVTVRRTAAFARKLGTAA
eukprot:1105070-Pleurochrysis_carterae.AAC.1